MVALLQRLPVEVPGQLGKVLAVEPDRHGDVLVGGGELVAHLAGEQLVESLGGHRFLLGLARRGRIDQYIRGLGAVETHRLVGFHDVTP